MREPCRFGLCLFLAAMFAGCGQDPSAGPIEPGADQNGVDGDSTPPSSLKNPVADPNATAEVRRFALLVGCTKYDHLPASASLKGPGNDADLMRQLLIDRFEFSEKDITILADHVGGRKNRPLRKNIEREFQTLAKKAGKGDQVVILLSGHGSQLPDNDPMSKDDLEPDLLDEIFLAADTKAEFDFKTLSIPNAIRDDEIRNWLNAIRDKGASVWLIVDSCHSGSSARSVEVRREIPREMLIPKDVLNSLARRQPKHRGMKSQDGSLDTNDKKGGLVAIYASQPHEPTVELKLPRDATDGQWRGLLTYSLAKVLTEAETPLTYTELVQRIHAEYISSQGRLGPTPLVEGVDRNREVLGQTQWPERSRLRIQERGDGHFKLSGGTLHGLTVGSILAVYPAAGDKKTDQPLGHVKITKASAMESIAAPCEYNGAPAQGDLPLGGTCNVVQVEYGDLRLKVAVDIPTTGESENEAPKWLQELTSIADEQTSVFQLVDDVAKADWLIRRLEDGQLVIAPAEGWTHDGIDDETQFGPVAVGEQTAAWMKERLSRIGRARMLMKISGQSNSQRKRGWLSTLLLGRRSTDIRIALLRLEDVEDTKGTPIKWGKNGLQLNEGDLVGVKVTNTGAQAVDFTLLFVDSSFGVDPIFPSPDTVADNRLQPGRSYMVGPMQVEGSSFGQEHVVVIAQKAQGQPVDFGWLGQDSIERVQALSQTRSAFGNGLDSPLGLLLQSTMFAGSNTRGMPMVDASNIVFRLLSWKTTANSSGN